eukprot:2082919-Prymnesium_polylepis.3
MPDNIRAYYRTFSVLIGYRYDSNPVCDGCACDRKRQIGTQLGTQPPPPIRAVDRTESADLAHLYTISVRSALAPFDSSCQGQS